MSRSNDIKLFAASSTSIFLLGTFSSILSFSNYVRTGDRNYSTFTAAATQAVMLLLASSLFYFGMKRCKQDMQKQQLSVLRWGFGTMSVASAFGCGWASYAAEHDSATAFFGCLTFSAAAVILTNIGWALGQCAQLNRASAAAIISPAWPIPR